MKPALGMRAAGPQTATRTVADCAFVVTTDPEDGASGIFRDAVVVIRLSCAVDPSSVSSTTVRVEDAQGEVPAWMLLSPDREVLIWSGQRLLAPDVEHRIVAEGLRGLRGEAIDAHESHFVPCNHVSKEWSP
jgi:hypothetical protein